MAAMERNPPQEVKSTCDETPVVKRMQVKRVDGWMGGGADVLCNGSISSCIRRRSPGFASSLKCHKYLKELSGPL